MSNFEDFLKKINDLRKTYGRNPVEENACLTKAATAHMLDMVNMQKLSHTGSSGSRFDVRMLQAGYKFRLAEEKLGFAAEIRAMKNDGLTANANYFAVQMSQKYWGMIKFNPAKQWVLEIINEE